MPIKEILSHILAPLTAMVSNKAKFVWDDTCQKAFDKIKEVISRETLLAFPDFKKRQISQTFQRKNIYKRNFNNVL